MNRQQMKFKALLRWAFGRGALKVDGWTNDGYITIFFKTRREARAFRRMMRDSYGRTVPEPYRTIPGDLPHRPARWGLPLLKCVLNRRWSHNSFYHTYYPDGTVN